MHTLLFRPNHRSFPVCQVSVEVEYYYLLSTRSRCSNRRSIPDSFGYPKGRNLSILNESTSSFRYPCLVHVFPRVSTGMDYIFILSLQRSQRVVSTGSIKIQNINIKV